MAYANRVMQPVKARAYPHALTYAAKPQAQVGMVQVLAELRYRDDGHELPRRHPYALRDADDDGVAQQIVQQVVATIAPLGHLAL